MTEIAVPATGYLAGRETAVLLHWRSSDPLVAELLFPDSPDGPRWEFSLGHLAEGCHRRTVEGDVEIRPEGMWTVFGVDADWYAEVEVPCLKVAEFRRMVAAESGRALDADLGRLLAGA